MAAPHETGKRRLLTAEDLYALPDDDKSRELVRGELRVSELPGWEQGAVAVRIAAQLGAYVEARRLGYVTCRSGYVLERGPDTVRGPDVAFIRRERRPGPDVEHHYVEGAPDLAVEIVSPTDLPGEIAKAVEGYLTTGARAVWVVHPSTRRVVVYTPDGAARALSEPDVLDGGDVVPGFSGPVAELFPPRPSVH